MNNREIPTKGRANLAGIKIAPGPNGPKKTFHPGEHLFFKRISLSKYTGAYRDIHGGQIEVPEGYQVLCVQNITGSSINGSVEGYGFDIWFINVKTVEASLVRNQALDIYDYSEPGTVVETLVEEPSPTLGLRRV